MELTWIWFFFHNLKSYNLLSLADSMISSVHMLIICLLLERSTNSKCHENHTFSHFLYIQISFFLIYQHCESQKVVFFIMCFPLNVILTVLHLNVWVNRNWHNRFFSLSFEWIKKKDWWKYNFEIMNQVNKNRHILLKALWNWNCKKIYACWFDLPTRNVI